MRTHKGTRFLSALLALLMVVSLLPASALAADADPVSGLKTGDKVAIFNDGNGKAMTATASGTRLAATDAALNQGGKLTGESIALFTVTVDDNGLITFANGGKVLTSGATGNSLTLAAEASDYSLWAIEDAGDGLFFVKNANAVYNGNAQYLEYYNTFTTYGKSTGSAAFAMSFRDVAEAVEPSGTLSEGDQVVIYNAPAAGVLGIDDSGLGASLSNVATVIEDGKASPANGAYVFTVGVDGAYFTFQTGGEYLATCDTEQLFLADSLSDTGESCTYWKLDPRGDGYLINSKTARYNGSGVVCIEFFSGAFSGWTFKSSDASIFIFNFYPLAEGIQTLDGVVNEPKVVFTSRESVVKQGAYCGTFTLDDLTVAEKIASVTVTCNGEPVQDLANKEKDYTFTVPAVATAEAQTLNIAVTVTYTDGGSYTGTLTVTVKDEPLFSELTPAPGRETGEDKAPLISAAVKNVSDGDTVDMTINGEVVQAALKDGVISYKPAEAMRDGRTSVKLTVTRADGVVGSKTWSFIVGEDTMQLYFGQLHSHTAYSDGSGSLVSALECICALPESANVQFVAFTDHSNYFDTTSAANPEGALYDMSLASEASQRTWAEYRQTVAGFNASQSEIVAIAGYEMTWAGGPGHINTFNSPGIVSRNNSTLNNKTNDAGLKAYYALLSRSEGADTISQFNHPGATFGNFNDFSYWDAVVDSRIYTVEVGNGEGQIGQGGYYPSCEQYTMALDKGWHVAPTNNQDNHKGRWGNANDARDVILTDDFTEQGIYDALRAMRLYATEDKNLEIYYTVNDQLLGSSISEIPETLEVNVQLSDPDSSDTISKVEVIVNSGKVVHTWSDASEIASGSLSVSLAPEYSYYYIRVTEADGDLAVTAPVWVCETLKLGISALTCGTAMPVTNEELTLTTSIFNSGAAPTTVRSITYTTSGSKVLGTDTTGCTVPASSTLDIPFSFTPDQAQVMKITATVVLEQDGKEYTFTKDITLDVQNADELVYIGIDASHYNEYVAGNYKDSMGNFAALASEYAVRTVYLQTSEELIAACGNGKFKMLIFTAPSRRLQAAQNEMRCYSADEIAAVQAFHADGGTVVLSGWSDYYENYAVVQAAGTDKHMAAQQNAILAALGSSLRIADDATHDNELNGGQTQRLYFSAYNMDNVLMQGVVVDPEHPNDRNYSEVFSHYGGASIYAVDASGTAVSALPGGVSPAVYGHSTTYSLDSDNDGLGGESVPKYAVSEGDNRLLITATEELEGKGMIVVSGAAFMSNFEVQAQASDGSSDADTRKNYSNYKVCENLVSPLSEAKVTDIADVQAQTEEGFKYTIEAVVTSNASGYDKDTAFFDCIYVQDDTAGICCFPVSGSFKVGDRVRITGTTDFYQGEPELQVTSITLLSEGNEIAPTEVSAKDVTSLEALGSLITVKGTVESFELANGLVQTIMVKDAAGDVVRVFIDGYITTDKRVEHLAVGAGITVTGLASYDDTFNAPDGPFPRIRIRDRADVIVDHALIAEAEVPATCEEPGEKAHWKCETCGKLFADAEGKTEIKAPEAIPALGHDWDEGRVTREPTLTEEGETTHTCKHDPSHVKIEPIPKLEKCGGGENCPSIQYTDVDRSADSWYHEAVDWAVTHDPFITDGIDDTHFGPNQSCTREQAVTFLWRAAGCPEPEITECVFTDVGPDSYAYKAILWAVEKGLTDGTSDTTFSPKDTCTRAHIVTFLYHAANSPAVEGAENVFTDVPANAWYTNAVLWAVSRGITDGLTETIFGPSAECSRAMIITFLRRDATNQ